MAKDKKSTISHANSKNHKTIPIIPIKGMVIFPEVRVDFYVGRFNSLASLKTALANDSLIFVTTQKSAEIEIPKIKDLFLIGVIGKIIKATPIDKKSYHVSFEGMKIAELAKIVYEDKIYKALVREVSLSNVSEKDKKQIKYISMLINEQLIDHTITNDKSYKKLAPVLNFESHPLKSCYLLYNFLKMAEKDKQKILESLSIKVMLECIYGELLYIKHKINLKPSPHSEERRLDVSDYKSYHIIKSERSSWNVTTQDDQKKEWKELEQKLIATNMPAEILEAGLKEIKKLSQLQDFASESNIIRSYLDCLINLPWDKATNDNLSLSNAQKILDKEHYGLLEVKERILDFIGIAKRTGELRGPILCLSGPPGVGKTSLAKSIANSLGRKFIRISLGGISDEAEIRGHRRTYIGAMPGKIINAIKTVQTINPVILLDEVDKISRSHINDPASALLEALDAKQNYNFTDHYLELGYDLSKVMFICTANNQEAIPLTLKDRMEIINLVGYSETEKRKIFFIHMLPKKLAETGLKKEQIKFAGPMIAKSLIRYYTKESGIRNLERELAKLLRRANRDLLANKNLKFVVIDRKSLAKYLGPPEFEFVSTKKIAKVGIVNGLAWTIMGGEILVIESTMLQGNGKLILTGKLGDVMRESAQTALSYVKSNHLLFGIDPKIFALHDIHLHATEAAIHKDGPSAGITLALVIVSILTNIPIKHQIALTGEITLHGDILKIGGLKEKLLAAMRANIKKVFIPQENFKQLSTFDKDTKKDLEHIEIRSFSSAYQFICNSLVRKPKMLNAEITEGGQETLLINI